ncbi:ABC transporter permease [Micromonospora echinospora]|uniref:ABC transporter permease n=1 Tax=Micromonospora echinospora TaxID=1877 RepID=UPI00378B72D8
MSRTDSTPAVPPAVTHSQPQRHYTNTRGEQLLRRYQRASKRGPRAERRLSEASQRRLVWARFKRHRLAVVSLLLLVVLYGVALLAEFVAPYGKLDRFPDATYASPTRIHLFHEGEMHAPFIYGDRVTLNPDTFEYEAVADTSRRYPVKLWVKTDPYKLAGVVPMDRKLFGTGDDSHPVLLLGADHLGRDLFSRILHASRVSLLVGFAGVLVSFVLGIFLGGLSGYFGGRVDAMIQRTIDFIISIPLIPLWMALSAAIPPGWSGTQTYFAITMILSLVGWTGLARVVRGKVISLREEDYVTAARVSSAGHLSIIGRHLLPALTSYLVVHITIAVPTMILGETTLSFLGLGVTAPDVSWGSLLQQAQDVTVVANYPWLLTPAAFLVVAVILFNFVGDGLRDAADPYSR